MSSFAFGRGRLRAGSRRTARAGRWQRAGKIGATAPALLPDRASQLGDGVVVETRLIARLMGMRLLRVDGIVLMSPARLVDPAPSAPSRERPRHTGSVPPNGHLLAQAAQLLQENDAHLRRLR